MRLRHFSRSAVVVCLALLGAACSDSTSPTSSTSPAAPGAGGTSSTLVPPSCDDNGVFVNLTLAGPLGRAFAWKKGNFTECHGGKVQANTGDGGTGPAASLQFDFAKGTGESPGGTFYVTLPTQPTVAVGKGLPAKVNVGVADPKLDLSFTEGCVAEITEVKEIGRFDNGQGPAYGIWEVYAGTARCDQPKRPIQPNGGEYTITRAEFRGISYRTVNR